MRNIAPLNIRISYFISAKCNKHKEQTHLIPKKQQLTNTSIDFAYINIHVYVWHICMLHAQYAVNWILKIRSIRIYINVYLQCTDVFRDLRRMTYQAKQRLKKEKPDDETKKIITTTTHIRSYPQQYKIETVTNLPFIF